MYEPFPLTEVQKSYILGRNNAFEIGGIATYGYEEIEGDIDVERLNMALNKVIERHPMLRAVFLNNIEQKFLDYIPYYKIEIVDLRNMAESEKSMVIKKHREFINNYQFDIEKWPPLISRLLA